MGDGVGDCASDEFQMHDGLNLFRVLGLGFEGLALGFRNLGSSIFGLGCPPEVDNHRILSNP